MSNSQVRPWEDEEEEEGEGSAAGIADVSLSAFSSSTRALAILSATDRPVIGPNDTVDAWRECRF